MSQLLLEQGSKAGMPGTLVYWWRQESTWLG